MSTNCSHSVAYLTGFGRANKFAATKTRSPPSRTGCTLAECPSENPFGGGDTPDTGIACNRLSRRSPECLERRLGDMVRVAPGPLAQVDRPPCVDRDGAEELHGHLGVVIA